MRFRQPVHDLTRHVKMSAACKMSLQWLGKDAAPETLAFDLRTVCMCSIRKKHVSISHISLMHMGTLSLTESIQVQWMNSDNLSMSSHITLPTSCQCGLPAAKVSKTHPLGCNPFCSTQRTGSQRSTQDRPKAISQLQGKTVVGLLNTIDLTTTSDGLLAQLCSDYDLNPTLTQTEWLSRLGGSSFSDASW